MTTRHDRIKMQRRMQRRIQLVVEERRLARQATTDVGEKTIEIKPRAIGRVSITR